MPDRVGQQLGNYQLLRLLGEGGFAEVYLGEHIHLGIQAAIKVLHTQLASEDIDKFRTEARIIARLIHPHIVRVLDFGIESKTPYLVMDYAPNGTLRQRHPKGSVLSLSLIVDHVEQVARALQYAHNEKLIHRDVKPENMLLGRHNEILLSDFGIALVAQSSRYQSTRDMAGTMAYMAPEQIQGKPRQASDQYALGIVVYEWLTGDRPFHGSLTELVGQHIIAVPPSLREKVPTISPEVDRIIQTALAKDPRQRFENVQAFANALRDVVPHSPSTVTVSMPTIESPTGASTLPPDVVPQAPSGFQPDVLGSSLTETKSVYLEPDAQAADIVAPSQMSTLLHSSPRGSLRNGVTHFLSQWPPRRRSSLLVGGTLGLLLILAALVITIGPIILVGKVSSTTTKLPQSVPSTTPAHLEIVPKWTFLTDSGVYAGNAVVSPPTVVNGVLYFGSRNHIVYAVDAETGQKKWAFATGQAVTSSPAVANGIVYIGSTDSSVYALDASTGQKIWTFVTGGYIDFSSPTFVNGVLYVGSDDFKVYALDASTGQKIWTFTTGIDIRSSPIVVNGVLYVSSDHLYALDANTGQQKWVFPAASYSPIVVDGNLYVGTQDSNEVYALDANTGQQRWAFPHAGLLAVANSIVYAVSNGKGYALDATTGQQRWIFSIGTTIFFPSTVVNGVLYIVSEDGRVYGINARTGHQKWVFSIGGQVSCPPVVINGVLYIGSQSVIGENGSPEDGKIYAFTLPTSSS